MNPLGINEQRMYDDEQIETFKKYYDNLISVDERLSNHEQNGFSNTKERSRLSMDAWKAMREYETQVPQDLQQLLRFDSVKFSERMERLLGQYILPKSNIKK